MAFQDPIASLTTQELKLTYQQLREMLRLARVTVEDCANVLGITARLIYLYVDDPKRVVPEDDIVQIIKIMRGVDRYKRFFHEAVQVRSGEYLCAWQTEEGARITFDDHLVYGLCGVSDRFNDLVKSVELRYRVLKNEGHVQLAFRVLGVELLPVHKKVMQTVRVVGEKQEEAEESLAEEELE